MDVPVNSDYSVCQTGLKEVSDNSVIAPDDANSRHIIKSYGWSTDIVFLKSGVGYRSKKDTHKSISLLVGVEVKTQPCLQTLIKCKYCLCAY